MCLGLFGVKIVRFKRSLRIGSLTLRVCRLKDLGEVYRLWTPERIPASPSKRKALCLFSFYRWMRCTFQLVYLIDIEENGGRRTVGLAGLYHMDPGRSVSLSLAVFCPQDRRRGYGEKALTLLLGLLRENGAAQRVYAEIFKSNVPSLHLCTKLGFKVRRRYPDRLLLEKRNEDHPNGGKG